MARDNKHMKGLDDLNKLFDSITDPKFRAKVLRAAAKPVMEDIKQAMEQAAPEVLKPGVIIKTTVNTGKIIKVSKSGKIADNKSSELYSEVTFRTKKGVIGQESYYGMAAILNYGRKNPLAKIGKNTKFYAFGKPTDETHRLIGVTKPLYFIDRVHFEKEKEVEEQFGKNLLDEIQKEVKRQDKRNARGKK
ncbi:hypothetical protein [Aeromonas caviae]|uniref:hypothetical protein n=1 Tax=Aeromonas caviae TaxID=648 RepID=UPI00111B81A1|nr:hypothetical protein [Aeromonas caviae]